MGTEAEDLDVTSKYHINRAIQRAENVFSLSSVQSPSSRVSERQTKQLPSRQLLKKSFQVSHIANNGYKYGIKSASSITSQEIKSSVRRSRRWSGRDKVPSRAQYVVAPMTNINLEPSIVSKDTNRYNQVYSSEETAYHRTVCDILSDKVSKSSYGHVMKIMSSPVGKSKPHKSNVRSKKAAGPNLPKIRTPLQQLNRDEGKTAKMFLATDKFDWALRYASRSSSNLDELRMNEIVGLPSPRTLSRPYQSNYTRGIKLSQVCDILSDSSQSNEINEVKIPVASPAREQAHRVISSYYKNKEQNAKRNQSNLVVIHLPTANVPTNNASKEVASPPRLLLRNNHKSALRPFFYHQDKCDYEENQYSSSTYFGNISKTNITAKRFLLRKCSHESNY